MTYRESGSSERGENLLAVLPWLARWPERHPRSRQSTFGQPHCGANRAHFAD
jgi:hypothetical protein